MKRFIITLTAVLVLTAIMSSCSLISGMIGGGTDSAGTTGSLWNSDTHTGEASAKETSGGNPPENGVTVRMDIKSYMNTFVNYFHEPYKAGDDLSDKNILSISFLYALQYESVLDWAKKDEQNMILTIGGDGLRRVAKNLFGDDVQLSDFHSFFKNTADAYFSESDTYVVAYARDYWGGDPYYFDETKELNITETDSTLTVTVDVGYMPELGTVVNERKMFYTFDKVIDGNVLFYRIKEIGVVQ